MLLFKSDVLSVRPQYERGMFWDRAEYNQGIRHKRNAVCTGHCRLNLRSCLPLMVISRRCGGAPLSVVHVLRSRLFDRHRDNCSSKIGRPHICASRPLVLLLYFSCLEYYPRLFAPGSFRLTPGTLLLNYLFETFCGDVSKLPPSFATYVPHGRKLVCLPVSLVI